ncbi:MAG: hypothetical protein WC538_13795 [Thermoanaerobaculia bacterium]|jgi:hypothetical protein
MKKTLILCAVMIVIGGALGAWGMHQLDARANAKAVDAATTAMRTERDTLARTTKMMELRLQIGRAAIEANRLNYGNARSEAEALFAAAEKLQGLVAGSADERELQMIVSRKEQILGDLAVGNPASAVALEQMYNASSKAVGAR